MTCSLPSPFIGDENESFCLGFFKKLAGPGSVQVLLRKATLDFWRLMRYTLSKYQKATTETVEAVLKAKASRRWCEAGASKPI